MNHSYDYDLLILGAGPGGYVAAIRAAQLKQKVALIEMDKIGGVCLNIGCIPSKSLLHQAEAFHSIRALEQMGLTVDKSGFDYAKVVATSRKVADTLSKGVSFLLKKNGVTVINGKGIIRSPHEILVNDAHSVTGNKLIIATGSRPRALPGFPFNETKILSSNGALLLQQLPKSMCIIGSGAIGIEFASVMNSFGVAVHIIEVMDRILPLEDFESSEVLKKLLVRRGITISTATRAQSMTVNGETIELTLQDNSGATQQITADKLLVVTGRTPNTESIGLENIGITPVKGTIPVGDYYQTSVPGVYAIGDVLSSPQLAHVASKEGEIAAEHAAGLFPHCRSIDKTSIPSGIYSEPQIAGFGVTEQYANEQNIPFKKATFPYRGIGKSVAIGASDGHIKLLTEPATGKLIGAHIVGAQATELIHELLLLKETTLPVATIASMIHAHPTLSEGVMEAARATEGWAIHV